MIVLKKNYRYSSTPLVCIDGEVRDSGSRNVIICVNSVQYTYTLNNGHFKAFIHLNQVVNNVLIKGDHSENSRLEKIIYKQRTSKNFVRLVYLICPNDKGLYDGSFQAPAEEDASLASALSRISVGAMLAQYFYSETLPNNKTFNLELNDEMEPRVHVLTLSKTKDELFTMSQHDIWEYVAKELLSSYLADSRCKYLAFCAFTRYTFSTKKSLCDLKYEDYLRMTKGFVSLGGGGLALVGTQCLYTWPTSVSKIIKCFSNDQSVDIFKFMNDSCNRGTLGGCFATTLGSAIHELGHTFDLGHSDKGIMDKHFHFIDELFKGNKDKQKYKWWNQCTMQILSNHKWFNEFEDKTDDRSAICLLDDYVKSQYGIIVIEYRDRVNSRTISYSTYSLPKKIVKLSNNNNCSIVVMDSFGNILKSD